MLLKFLIYGTIGWAGEIVWTALYELYTGTRKDPLDPRIREGEELRVSCPRAEIRWSDPGLYISDCRIASD